MMYDFNASDIFQMAEELERNGALFYRNASKNIGDKEVKNLLLDLADMEDKHEKTFQAVGSTLMGSERSSDLFDPDDQSAQYLRAFMETKIFFEKKLDTTSTASILKDAIAAEKDSIVFYLGLKEFVPEKRGRDRIESIIKEEMDHIRLLSQMLKKQYD